MPARIGDLIVRSKNLGCPFHQVVDGVEHRREPLCIRFRQVIGRVAVDDAVGEIHPCPAARRNPDRIHTASEKKT